MSVCGLDLSLAATGIALVGPGKTTAETIVSKGKRADDLTTRRRRLSGLTEQITERAAGCSLAVIEAPAGGVVGGSSHDRSGLWWLVVDRLHGMGVPVATVAPTTVKRWATGSGRAEKVAVALAVARLWPDNEISDDNQADALALATMGAQATGIPGIPRLARHNDVLTVVAWPQQDAGGVR